MTTQVKSINAILQDRAIPAFVKDNYPTYVAFVDAFNSFLEQQKYPFDVAINLQDYRDIDETLDEFVDYFQKEYLVNIPSYVLADKRLLAKQIKNFYLNKGNEASYRFLFRILYNDSIEFYYPKVDILRASDGKWYEQKSLKITLTDPTDLAYMNNSQVIGVTSGATAIIESAIRYVDRGATVVELSLSDIRGQFTTSENVQINTTKDNESYVITESIYNLYTGVQIDIRGSGYSLNDRIVIRDGSDNEIAQAVISKVSKGPIVSISIGDEGIGYNGETKIVTKFYNLPIGVTLTGNYLPTTAISVYQTATLNDTVPNYNLVGTGDIIQINDGDGSTGTGDAFGVVSTVDNDGRILDVRIVNFGTTYEAPTAVVISDTGTGAVIDVVGGSGAIAEVKMQSFPIILNTDADSVYPDFTSVGEGNATGHMTIGSLAQYPGVYLNEDGQLSSSKKLQDNFYYQDYSYVIKAGSDINTWRDVVKKIIHPAGQIVFGEIDIITVADAFTYDVVDSSLTITT